MKAAARNVFVFSLVLFTLTGRHGECVEAGVEKALIPLIPVNLPVTGFINDAGERDWYAFQAQAGAVYVIRLRFEFPNNSVVELVSSDGSTVLRAHMGVQEEVNMLGWRSQEDGTSYATVQADYTSQIISYTIEIREITSEVAEALDLVAAAGQTHQALLRFETLVEMMPDDPEVNLYLAALRLVDIVETRDVRLTQLLNAFGASAVVFPHPTFEHALELPDATEQQRLGEITDYAVDVLLPAIDASLRNMDTVLQAGDIHLAVSDGFFTPADAGEGGTGESDPNSAQREWFEGNLFDIDTADIQVLSGGLLMAKAAILALSGFDLGVEAKVLDDAMVTVEDLMNPPEGDEGDAQDLARLQIARLHADNLVNNYPDFLSAKDDVQSRMRAALHNWLAGTGHVRRALEGFTHRMGSQSAHVFYLDGLEAELGIQYLALLDRVFTGLLMVSGGDVNGDTKVDYWDLHTLRHLWSD